MSDEKLELDDTPACCMESSLIDLAACKIEDINLSFSPEFLRFKHKTYATFKNWIEIIKSAVHGAGMPLKAELMDLIHESSDGLGHCADAESLGVNSRRIHPDTYINEAIIGMRANRQMLEFILKKIDTNQEFKLDRERLYKR